MKSSAFSIFLLAAAISISACADESGGDDDTVPVDEPLVSCIETMGVKMLTIDTTGSKDNSAQPPELHVCPETFIRVTFKGDVSVPGSISMKWKNRDSHSKDGRWLNVSNGADNSDAAIFVPESAGTIGRALPYSYSIFVGDSEFADPKIIVDPPARK